MRSDRRHAACVGAPGWSGRTALLLGVAGATIGGMLLGAGPAHATAGRNPHPALGTIPGAVQLNPAAGPTSSRPTWATTHACGTGFRGSAVFREVHRNGKTTSNISRATNAVAAPFGGRLRARISTIRSRGRIPRGGTQELVVICFSGPRLTGASDPEMDIFITYSADGRTYTTSATSPATGVHTTTRLTARPDPATAGQPVTLRATEVAADGTHPAGSVQFQAAGTLIGSPVTVNASGVATATTTFAAAGTQPLSAVFTPADAARYRGSTGTYREVVRAPAGSSGSEPLAVTVPVTGTFTLTIAPGTVNLTVRGPSAAGMLNPVTVSDTRNTYPGWSVSGQATPFAGSGTAAGSTISGDQLGWTPAESALAGGVTLGPAVVPGDPGLGATPTVLASARAGSGFGASDLGATLMLAIPSAAKVGPYASTLTLTAVTSLP